MTTNHWVIAPFRPEDVRVFERMWDFDYQRGLIAIDWPELGDVSNLSRQDLVERRHQVYGDKYKRAHIPIWQFWHEIGIGDTIIAKTGRRRMLAIGTVTREAFYDEELGRERAAGLTDFVYPNFIGVEWERREFEFPDFTFAIGTLKSITAERYEEIVDASARRVESAHQWEEDLPLDELGDPSSISRAEFVLERHLEEFIVSNFEAIDFEQRLILYDDGKGTPSNQYPTSVGRIDILARNADTGDYVVIELKKGRPADTVVGQTLRYMGWVKLNLCEQGQDTQGLIICSDQDPKLAYALNATMNISAWFYSVGFELNRTPPD